MHHFFYRFVLALLMWSVLVLPAFGLGLGEIRVRSSLGQNLLAHADIIGSDTEIVNASCLRARILTMDGIFVASANITVYQNQKKRALSFTTRQHINEPAINLVIDINCETQLHREFSILLDPPELNANVLNVQRDESPFAAVPTARENRVAETADVLGSSENKQTTTQQKKKRENRGFELAENKKQSSYVDKPLATIENKRKKHSPAKDVLKLSDEVVIPMQHEGLRMSDVLSTESGKALVQNMEELRVAQAKMAAILRDEQAPIENSATNKDAGEIASLRSQAEQLKKQNLLDKAALTQLQNKSGFDSWLIILAIVAIVAIFIILFLLLYIRRNLTGKSATWWEDETLESQVSQPEKIEDVIKNLHASYDSNRTGSDELGASEEKRNSGSVAVLLDIDPFEESTRPKPASTENATLRTPSLEETNSSIFNFFTPRGSSVKVEEISDVTQEAEFWISMNDPQRAIEILSAQEKIEQPDSPVPWLFLLDLYRTVKDKVKYDQLRDRFIVFFNANIPEYDTDLSQVEVRHLEDFSHLVQRICDGWNSQEIIPYLESLLIDDREGKRSGFDLPVYRDILMLLGIAHELDRITAIEGPVKSAIVSTSVSQAANLIADPVGEADFGTIEFEMIDFPKMEGAKKPS
ncbi:type IV pilus assembly protein FimV [Undibacterium sp. Di24W]|uniref:type IV pilus assembly protein FimV n=1 Tax=Undibacterium sp. Di24W TaxID=3413033 RepID=UPI003BF0F9F0